MGAPKIENPKCHCNTPGLFNMISFMKNKVNYFYFFVIKVKSSLHVGHPNLHIKRSNYLDGSSVVRI
jgi:hypothetical protein